MAGSTLGSAEMVDLSSHDWSIAKDISRDGKFVLFEDASEAAGPHYAVELRGFDGSLPARLGDGSAGGLSPDAKWAISFSMTSPEKIILLPIGPGQPRPVNQTGLEQINTGWARFLPNGRQLTVNASEPGHAVRCYLLDVDVNGAKPRVLTPEGTRCGPASPDGRFIVGTGPGPINSLYPIAGGPPRLVPGLQAGLTPLQWSDDNSFLYFYREGEFPCRIYKVAIATGKQSVVQELLPNTPAGVVVISPIVVSGDGTRFAYSYNETLSVLYLISGLK